MNYKLWTDVDTKCNLNTPNIYNETSQVDAKINVMWRSSYYHRSKCKINFTLNSKGEFVT